MNKIFAYIAVGAALMLTIYNLYFAQSKDVHIVEATKDKMYERDYQESFCKSINGITEYRLEDKTRIDCLTDEYAIEVDFAKKWAEGIGQSLHYGLKTNRKPAVALIVTDEKKEAKYLKRLNGVAKEYEIKVFVIKE
jgi:hypothetical protein